MFELIRLHFYSLTFIQPSRTHESQTFFVFESFFDLRLNTVGDFSAQINRKYAGPLWGSLLFFLVAFVLLLFFKKGKYITRVESVRLYTTWHLNT